MIGSVFPVATLLVAARPAVRIAAAACGLFALASCNATTGSASGVSRTAPPPLTQASLAYETTPYGKCMPEAPNLPLRPVPDCRQSGASPLIPNASVNLPGFGRIGTGDIAKSIQQSQRDACEREAQEVRAYNQDIASLNGQQCMSRSDIAKMQEALTYLEYYRGPADGDLGPKTYASMQKWHGGRSGLALGPTKEFGQSVINSARTASNNEAAAALLLGMIMLDSQAPAPEERDYHRETVEAMDDMICRDRNIC